MDIILNINNQTAVLKIIGRLDTVTAPELDNEINELNVNELILDFEKLDYISSAGLRVLLTTHKKYIKKVMKIINVNESVMEVFEMTGFADILNIE